MNRAVLALAEGAVFEGVAAGAAGTSVGEVVFNTAMTGYQEILTDPSYAGQIVTLTYPHIGNTGTNAEDVESGRVWASGLVVRSLPKRHSNWRSDSDLRTFLERENCVAIAEVDTRELTRIIREQGAQGACITASHDSSEAIDINDCIKRAQGFQGLSGQDLVKGVTCKAPIKWHQGLWQSKTKRGAQHKIVAYDFGVKHNILRYLTDRQCQVTLVPATTSAREALAHSPDGIFLSNGPGDPEPLDYAISTIAELIDSGVPIFGICLGHQLLSLACGARTVKMPFGHHGANHPIKSLASNRVMISSQNHGFAVDADSIPDCLEVTHVSLFDGSVQGVRHRSKPAFSVQGHPEASPGPQDVARLFDEFVSLMTAGH